MNSFLLLVNTVTYTNAQKEETMELVQIYFIHLNKTAIITNFLAVFLFLFEKFSLVEPDPDPGGKMNADPCRSISTALLLTHYIVPFSYLSNPDKYASCSAIKDKGVL